MYKELDSLTFRHKIAQDELTCHMNDISITFMFHSFFQFS